MCQALSGLHYANTAAAIWHTRHQKERRLIFSPLFSFFMMCTASFVTVFSALEWKRALYVICIVCGREPYCVSLFDILRL